MISSPIATRSTSASGIVDRPTVALVAARVGKTRLIDNEFIA